MSCDFVPEPEGLHESCVGMKTDICILEKHIIDNNKKGGSSTYRFARGRDEDASQLPGKKKVQF